MLTEQETSEIISLLHNDSDKFYTALSAYKLDFDVQKEYINPINNFIKHNTTIINYIIKQTPHLLQSYVKYNGKFNSYIENIEIYYNINIYSNEAIVKDISNNNLHLYVKIIDELDDICKDRIYELLSKDTFSLIIDNNLRIPTLKINENYILLYIVYMSSKNDFLTFMDNLNNPLYIYNNYNNLRCDKIDYYLLKNVNIITQLSLDNLINSGMKLKTILKYRPQFNIYSIGYINTIEDLMSVINSLDEFNSVKFIDELIIKYQNYSDIIKDRIRIVNDKFQ